MLTKKNIKYVVDKLIEGASPVKPYSIVMSQDDYKRDMLDEEKRLLYSVDYNGDLFYNGYRVVLVGESGCLLMKLSQ